MSKLPSPFVVTPELAGLAKALADWAEPAPAVVCAEIGDRLRISLSNDQSPLPTFLKLQLDELREREKDYSPSIVPSMRADDF
jgi:hypothetical protein